MTKDLTLGKLSPSHANVQTDTGRVLWLSSLRDRRLWVVVLGHASPSPLVLLGCLAF